MYNSDILVSVFVTTYNYEDLISDTLEGILKQKTSFKYEIVVHDDASTDGTQDIIKKYYEKYPDVIVPILRKKNIHSVDPKQVATAFLDVARGKYVAICEGDDYWIDEYKLQKQVDFMENNPDYSMCFTNAWKYDVVRATKTIMNTFPKAGTYSLEENVRLGLGSNYPAAATYFWRLSLYEKMFKVLSLELEAVGDYPCRVLMASYGKVYYFDEPTAVYRYGVSGSFTQKVNSNSKFYLDYFFGMSKMYQFINEFLGFQFDKLFDIKMKSEYLGLVSKVSDSDLEDYFTSLSEDYISCFDKNLYTKCREIVSTNRISKSLSEYAEQNMDDLYLYGTSPLAEKIFVKLLNNGIEINGFIVSDGFGKPDEFQGKKTLYLSELAKTTERASIILSVQPINEISIIDNIKVYKNIDYCSLF